MTSHTANGLIAPAAIVRVPQDVVFRNFPAETVVLNLKTGLYHGMSPIGGRMLETLGKVGRVRVAAEILAEEFGESVDLLLRDLCAFCFDLAERQLIEIEHSGV